MKRQAVKHGERWLLVLVLACAVSRAAWATQPPDRDLLERATRLRPWAQDDQAFPLSGRALLRLHKKGWMHTRAFRLDTRTGRETPLRGLSAVLAKHDVYEDWAVSPDGRRLLFSIWGHADRGVAHGAYGPGSHRRRSATLTPVAYGVCRLDGAGLVEMPRPVIDGQLVWLRDGRSWVCLDKNLAEHHPSHEDPYISLNLNRLGSAQETYLPLKATDDDLWRVDILGRVLGVLTDGRILLRTSDPVYDPNDPSDRTEFAKVAVAPGAAIRFYSVRLPQGVSLNGLLLSPRGDRLAWLTKRATPSRTQELWTSDPGGGRRHAIGSLTMPTDESEPSLVQWTGDERTLTFEYRHALYAVPTDLYSRGRVRGAATQNSAARTARGCR